MKRLLLCSTLLVAACAGPDYVKTGAGPDQVSRDRAECDTRTSEAFSHGRDFGRVLTGKARLMDGCMAARGYEINARR
ncbi:MAG TPA: hypothetical protein VM491_19280 [Burkholderiaceae bacterium]|nr:hypothetical protein [Burkholderiaceae bacterium]